jgi:hypothetical protein
MNYLLFQHHPFITFPLQLHFSLLPLHPPLDPMGVSWEDSWASSQNRIQSLLLFLTGKWLQFIRWHFWQRSWFMAIGYFLSMIENFVYQRNDFLALMKKRLIIYFKSYYFNLTLRNLIFLRRKNTYYYNNNKNLLF